MIKALASAVVALSITSGIALAQTTTPVKAPAADPAVEAKFKAADKNGNSILEGAELDAFKANLTAIDKDKDGKVSKAEFADAVKAGIIK